MLKQKYDNNYMISQQLKQQSFQLFNLITVTFYTTYEC